MNAPATSRPVRTLAATAAYAAPDALTRTWLVLASNPLAQPGVAPALPAPDTAALVQALRLHGTAPLALRRLANTPHLHALHAALRADQARNVGRAFAQLDALRALDGALGGSGVPWAVLKGVPLAWRGYGDVAARRVGDLDVLVAPSRATAADAALRDAGWQPRDAGAAGAPPRWWHERCYRRGELTLELHHRIHPNPRLVTVRTEALLEGSVRCAIGALQVPVLDPVMDLLYLATHGSRHGWFRLLWVADVAVLAARATPAWLDQAWGRAQALGVQRPLAQALLLAGHYCNAPVPAAARHEARRSPRARHLLDVATDTLFSARDARAQPVGRAHSSLLAALCQRSGLGFWAWEVALRARHEWQRLAGAPA